MIIEEMLTAALGKIQLGGESRTVAESVQQWQITVPPKPSMLEQLGQEVASQSTRSALLWAQNLLLGNRDTELKEIVHQNYKSKSIDELMLHSKLNFKDLVLRSESVV